MKPRHTKSVHEAKSHQSDEIRSSTDVGKARARRHWLILLTSAGVAVVVVVAFVFLQPLKPTPAVPRVSTNQLDASSVAVLERQLEEVRAAAHSGKAWGKLGIILRSLEYHTEALSCLAEAERLEPREPRWPYFQALLLMERSPDAARAKLRRVVDLCGNQPDAPRLHLATLLAEAGQWDEAKKVLLPLIQSIPEHGPALLGLAQIAQ